MTWENCSLATHVNTHFPLLVLSYEAVSRKRDRVVENDKSRKVQKCKEKHFSPKKGSRWILIRNFTLFFAVSLAKASVKHKCPKITKFSYILVFFTPQLSTFLHKNWRRDIVDRFS